MLVIEFDLDEEIVIEDQHDSKENRYNLSAH